MSAVRNRFLALFRSSRTAPVVVAHRGDSFHAPENTLEAARLAWEAGAEAWELDVQLTRDGVPIVLHDESLLRTTDVARRFAGDPRGQAGFLVSDFDLAEVQSLDAGSWFVDEAGGPRTARSFRTHDRIDRSLLAHYRSGKVVIPTLADALVLTNEHDWLVNVEIKSFPERPTGVVERVLDAVTKTDTATSVLISSFDHFDVVRANRPDRDHALGILAHTPLYKIHDYAADFVSAETVHVSAEFLGSRSIGYRRSPAASSLRTDVIHDLEKRRLPILVYTVNHHGPASLAEHLRDIGVNGLFTDDPAGMRRFFESDSSSAH
jgi:glycerophosphoryl diester phosphodiesterase